jgi:hypothetical protein
MAQKKPRARKCLNCKKWFTPEREGQKNCSPECAINHSINSSKQTTKKEKTKAKKELNQNDKSYLMKEAQKAFNAFIRKRDENQGCISCGNKTRQMHAGHYRPIGRNSALRFDEHNCHSQCSICNNHLSGNLNEYRFNLIEKIGLQSVISLEENNEPKSWSIEELRSIIKTYKEKIKTIF